MKTSTTPNHPLNPETADASVLTFIRWANEELHRAAQRTGDRREWSLRCATGNMGMAAYQAERAAMLRGHRFSLLSGRDLSIDEVFASADGRAQVSQVAA